MQEIPRAILLPPPSAQRSTRGTSSADQDLPVEVGARRSANAGANSFLALIETRREDSVEFSLESKGGKQFRFRPYTNRGTAERDNEPTTIERPAAGELTAPDDSNGPAARAVFDGFESGDGSRNSTAFLASFIAQEQLSEGLYNPPYGGASDAYRRAGGLPPIFDNGPRVASFAA